MAEAHLRFKELPVISGCCTLYGIMFGIIDLVDDLACLFGPAAAAACLHQKIKCILTAAVVGTVQTLIPVQDTHQRNIGVIQSFSDHLCTKQDICLMSSEFLQDLLMTVLA